MKLNNSCLIKVPLDSTFHNICQEKQRPVKFVQNENQNIDHRTLYELFDYF